MDSQTCPSCKTLFRWVDGEQHEPYTRCPRCHEEMSTAKDSQSLPEGITLDVMTVESFSQTDAADAARRGVEKFKAFLNWDDGAKFTLICKEAERPKMEEWAKGCIMRLLKDGEDALDFFRLGDYIAATPAVQREPSETSTFIDPDIKPLCDH